MTSIVANPVPIPVLHDSMSNQHFTNAFKKILELYYDRKLCDVTLLCNNREIEIHAHRIILSSVSEYFCGMFTNNLAETFKDQIEIIGDGEALKIIVEFIYTGKIELNDTNVFQILSAANFLQLSIVIKHCCDYLSKNLNIHNCVSINRFSRQQSLKQLNSSSYKYILDHFEKIGANTELLNGLSEIELLELFDDEKLNVIKEEFVFESLLKWINLNKEARFGSIGKLLAKIKLPLLEASYLTKQIENNKLLSANSECQSLMLEATLYHINPDKFRSSPIARTQPRKSTQGFLLSIGGIDLSKNSNNYFMEKYDCRTEKWTPVSYSLSTNSANTLNSTSLSISTSTGQNINPNLIHQASQGVVSNIVKRLQFATAIFGNNLYVVGGREHLKTLNTVECFDLNKQVWTLVSPTMLTHRHGLQATFLNNEPILYAIGKRFLL
jgi:kelch-like protein 1/4/5